MATLDDIAKMAGVSATTVSRVINNYGSLSEKDEDKSFCGYERVELSTQ
jgi:Transcriptional regulators